MAYVLIVDDEPSIVLPLEYLMQQHGHETHVLADGAAVLPALEERLPDLVLLDVMLPNQDGYALCEAIRARAAWDDLKIVMLTVKSRAADREKGRALGADAYITKPFSVETVVATVQEQLRAA
ncbi:response regulator transcription factor [Salisaeta longa]|uniref:response regulator transcription factor n=1 Tax=Salisaeta longa TaxID=503170 RepID=UPI0003B56DF2|nr:response regulator [Salisaeta longa]